MHALARCSSARFQVRMRIVCPLRSAPRNGRNPRRTRRCKKRTRAERSKECRLDDGPPLAQYNLLYAVLISKVNGRVFVCKRSWCGWASISKVQSLSTSLENPTSHLAHSRRHLPYYTLPTHSPHDGTTFSTSQHTRPKPWTPWTSQTLQEGNPASFMNLYSPFP